MNIFRSFLELLRGEPQNIEKLKRRGLVVGSHFRRMGGCIIDPSHCFHIRIGDFVTLAPRVHILAHDASTYDALGKTRVGNVKIGNHVFVGASSIILPGVTIGDNSIIGAGSVVTKDVPENCVYAGNPAHFICYTDVYINNIKAKMNESNTFVGLWYEGFPDECNRAISAAEYYGEIYVS